jgi:hypothetical protein
MVNVMADFPQFPAQAARPYVGNTVLDLKVAVDADPGCPLANVGSGNLYVFDANDNALNDGDPLVDGATYHVHSEVIIRQDGGGNNQIPVGQDGYGQPDGIIAVWAYFAQAQGADPRQYQMPAAATAAQLKEAVTADQEAPVAGELFVYDGTKWLDDADELVDGAPYTIDVAR